MNEFELIERYFVRPQDQEHLVIGNGDDCAVFAPDPDQSVAATVDTLIAGVHFPQQTSPEDLGHKALAVNLSDLAAMGAEPRWVSLALSIPSLDESWLAGFSRGFFQLADAYGVTLMGGDLTRGPLSVTIQALGQLLPEQALTRGGALAGDGIYVSGHIGNAGLGLLLHQGKLSGRNLSDVQQQQMLDALFRPVPRVELGLQLRGLAHAAIDVSDGLLADLEHILVRSGVGATVDLAAIPVAACYTDIVACLPEPDFAYWCGDDYELCFTMPRNSEAQLHSKLRQSQQVRVTRIGEVTQNKGLKLLQGGTEVARSRYAQGYRHF